MVQGARGRYPGRRLCIIETVPEGVLDRFMRGIDRRRSTLARPEMSPGLK
ncbi:hypothetical protein ACFFP0_14160 [Rhizobium puerariae]|uniref:Uncharacterized protein n=1 Tax=Rhizobium puerariae TaxID=1585791 RepID=A0ABV6AIT4_9HYPH